MGLNVEGEGRIEGGVACNTKPRPLLDETPPPQGLTSLPLLERLGCVTLLDLRGNGLQGLPQTLGAMRRLQVGHVTWGGGVLGGLVMDTG